MIREGAADVLVDHDRNSDYGRYGWRRNEERRTVAEMGSSQCVQA